MEADVLEKIGLDKNEARVYLVLLGLGKCTAMDLFRKTKIDRTHIYRILDSLIDKGLASFVIENRVKKFSASSPDELILQLKEKEASLIDILPKLKKISLAKSNDDPFVEIYSGTKGVKTLVNELLKIKKDYYVLCGDYLKPNLKVFFTHFMKAIERENIREKILLKEGFVIPISKNTEIRFLPKKYPLTSTTAIGDGFVGIVIGSDPFLAISIKSKELSDTYQSYFDLLWGIAKK